MSNKSYVTPESVKNSFFKSRPLHSINLGASCIIQDLMIKMAKRMIELYALSKIIY
jgi:hypothetical protein